MRDELWFIEFGRGAALPLTPEEAPGGDGEPIVPCAQGRIIVETARPAPPDFATCSAYRRRPILLGANSVASFGYTDFGKGAIPRGTSGVSGGPQSPATRPEDLGVTPWFADESSLSTPPPSGLDPRHNSHPLHCFYGDRDLRSDFSSTRNSSVEGEPPRAFGAQRKAYMDLRDAIALLDETCPNPDNSEPSPRTPRTPLSLRQKSKRTRSKSSDNSSNYSNERINEKTGELFNQQTASGRNQEREKKRPFLRKIGISKTEDRPFLSKLTPRIIGKPYLEKIGPSKAVEKPFLDKIGSSKTIDKFTFNITPRKMNPPEPETFIDTPMPRLVPRDARISFRKRSGKGQLQKMYSFETEDLTSFKDSLSPVKSPRDPLRGASLDDVLESGPSSLPPLEVIEQPDDEVTDKKSHSVAELVKCRIMSSEEIISSSSCLCSPQEAVSWGNSPKRKNGSLKPPSINSPMKRQISSSDSPEPRNTKELAVLKPGEISPTKSLRSLTVGQFGSSTVPNLRKEDVESSPRRQTSEDVLDRMEESIEGGRNRTGRRNERRENKNAGSFERRGLSSDNLKQSREIFIRNAIAVESRRREEEDEEETGISERIKVRKDISKEAFRQLHSKFETKNITSSEESNDVSLSRSQKSSICIRDRSSSNERSIDYEDGNEKKWEKREEEKIFDEGIASPSFDEDNSRVKRSMRTVRSVLRKQKSIDQPLDMQESDVRSLRKPKRRIFHEPSQETMDLLTELRKVKSLLKTPSVEKLDKREDSTSLKYPKKILLTDKEFCLSIDRENSIRRPSSKALKENETADRSKGDEGEDDEEKKKEKEKGKEEEIKLGLLAGPALFEKRGLSLDYADEEKPMKPEARAISLASGRSPQSETEETNSLEFGFTLDSKSYCSDVFNSPTSDEIPDNSLIKQKVGLPSPKDLKNSVQDEIMINNYGEVDIAIPIDQKTTPKRRVQIQGRTSDLYEIISPRSTPFRVKQRLSKISVEDTMKQESFTLNKVDSRSIAVQKRNKCFPL